MFKNYSSVPNTPNTSAPSSRVNSEDDITIERVNKRLEKINEIPAERKESIEKLKTRLILAGFLNAEKRKGFRGKKN